MADTLPSLQREVQRKLGRCMLRLQQYERLMKALVANMAVQGPPEKLQAIRDKQVLCANTKTLGTLIGMFTGSYLNVSAPQGQPAPEDAGADDKLPSESWIRMNFSMSMPPDLHAQTKQAVAELVDMRNDLVHHFLERFDLWDESGCRAAEVHLDACFDQIDDDLQDLTTWAASLEQARAMMLSTMQSQQFENALVHGIGPDGAVHWPISTIVECLRNAEQVCAIDGWTLLNSAIAHVRGSHPDQTPELYGCGSWRHVIHASQQFDILKKTNQVTGGLAVWYRSRSEKAAVNNKQAS